MSFKSGTVAIIGRPNVGKSTLVNALVGEKVTIVSDKPETTRSKILGVLHRPEGQIVFVDTPGIHKPRILLGKEMVRLARSSLMEVDLVLCMIDGSAGIRQDDRICFDLLTEDKPKAFLLLNKIDQVRKARLLPILDECRRIYPFIEMIPISALKADGLDRLVERVFAVLSEGPPLFPKEQITDKGVEFMASELIREAALDRTWEEVPHSVAVAIEEMKDRSTKLTYVRATIYVERESHRKILIGQRGESLKAIGAQARKSLESYLGRRVYLDLWVKVLEEWRQDPRSLHRFGYA